ncbi:uncharacterized protein LOC126784012 [Argentina anserina]|uniref:uncharacterized protein LOC126784012 n=1 Tax=Argentina anserina TaxID=57926 RepID=UPI0021765456|nr:uncharacterized protein LOC126784012 [Potentilla anserina]
MDLAPMKRDIDDLISQFSAADSTRFAHMKQLPCHQDLAVGGLYCLYCLYETQPFKIYLSLEELKKLRQLVADAKVEGVVVKRVLEKKVFLFGCVETNEGLKGKVDQLTKLENARIRTACEKLFGDGRIEEFSRMDLGVEVDLGKVRQMCGEYAELKRVATEEGGDEEMKGAEGGGKEMVGEDCQGVG